MEIKTLIEHATEQELSVIAAVLRRITASFRADP